MQEHKLPTWRAMFQHAFDDLHAAKLAVSQASDWLNSDWRPPATALIDAASGARIEVQDAIGRIKDEIANAKGALHVVLRADPVKVQVTMNDTRDHRNQPSPAERPHRPGQPARRPTLTELLDTWKAWSYRDLLHREAAKAEQSGETERAEVLTRGLECEPVVTPLDALAANDELSRQLIGWQWHAVRAAREAGATWQQIGTATNTTAELARADYLRHIERAEQHAAAHTDTAAYRAVLDDQS